MDQTAMQATITSHTSVEWVLGIVEHAAQVVVASTNDTVSLEEGLMFGLMQWSGWDITPLTDIFQAPSSPVL